MLIRLMTAAAVFALSAWIETSAQTAPDTAISGERVINSIQMTDMRAVLRSFGHVIVQDAPAENSLMVRAPNGFEYVLMLKRCDARNFCGGVLIGTIHPIPNGTTWELLNQIDSQIDLVGIYVMNERLIMDRYIALQGGIRLNQVRHEIASLAQTVPPLLMEISQRAAQNTG